MKIAYKMGFVASAALLAVSVGASAADIAKGVYGVNGYITKSSCGSLSPTLKVGTASAATVIYPGAGVAGMVLANPATSATGGAGSAASQVCVAVGKVPAAGLPNASITFNCFNDTVSGPAAKAEAQLKSTFKVGASQSPYIKQVSFTSSVVVGGSALCSFTTDATYALQ